MTTNQTYERIMSEIPPGMEREIMIVLMQGHVGQENRISRPALCIQVANKTNYYHKSKNTLDRQVRKSIENLQEAGYPILSDSGQGGYWLGRPDEVLVYIAELESRMNSLTGKIRALRLAKRLHWIDPPKPPVQQRLW